MSYITRKIKRASARGTRMANIRWERDRKMRDALAAVDPVRFDGHVVKRVIVIDKETTAKEIAFYDFDTYADRRRKLTRAKALSLA